MNIIKNKMWKRNCPRCNRILTYSNKYKLQNAIKSNSQCLKCCNSIILDNDFYYRMCPSCKCNIQYKNKSSFYTAEKNKHCCKQCSSIGKNIGIKRSLKSKRRMSSSQKGRKHTEETKQKISGKNNGMYGIHRYGSLNPFYGKKHTEKTRRKMRIAACKRVLQKIKNGRFSNSNPKEETYFRLLEQKNQWNGIYNGKCKTQYFIENLGYFVDYYEPSLNIVIEYDEPRHYINGNLKEKDIERMNKIKNHLKCKFLRFNEYTGELKEYGKFKK